MSLRYEEYNFKFCWIYLTKLGNSAIANKVLNNFLSDIELLKKMLLAMNRQLYRFKGFYY